MYASLFTGGSDIEDYCCTQLRIKGMTFWNNKDLYTATLLHTYNQDTIRSTVSCPVYGGVFISEGLDVHMSM